MTKIAEARLHSIETLGLVDGPGIRTVFFLQGCPLRCLYCHNPDSQTMFSKRQISSDEVVEIAKRYKPYYKNTGGGVTFSGGEPLLQAEFIIETAKKLKEEGITTAIDTTGYGDKRYLEEVLKHVDIVLLDIKHFDNEGYKNVTGKSMGGFYNFLSLLDDFNGTIWIRHVMVPSFTDNKESIINLFNRVKHLAHKINRFEILPYHKMGLEKYERLNRKYPLEGIPEMDREKAQEYQDMLAKMLEQERKSMQLDKKIG
ncbi:MAG TPA: pyruvate formate-lyase-activating protein [Tissierellaceae bacterium]|nr:pyruvate formate-lyase-activating protein [Tissierellaceae bacterium]